MRRSRGLEFTDGRLETLPTPTRGHQAMSRYLLLAWLPLVQAIGGELFYALCGCAYARASSASQISCCCAMPVTRAIERLLAWRGLGGGDRLPRERDMYEKRLDYAEARIPEYWIVNPLDETITVLSLEGSSYAEHGVFRRGERAESALLDGLAADVAEVFDAA